MPYGKSLLKQGKERRYFGGMDKKRGEDRTGGVGTSLGRCSFRRSTRLCTFSLD